MAVKKQTIRKRTQSMPSTSASMEHIGQSILLARGHKVLLDSDLALLYGVTTARLNQQVRRNLYRFPDDFMFQLTADEQRALMLQFATSKSPRGGRRKLALVFTEHGAVQAANVLNSRRAAEMGIHVVRAFVQLRSLLASNKELARKLDELERKVSSHDQAIVGILDAIRELMAPSSTSKRSIGFVELQERKKA